MMTIHDAFTNALLADAAYVPQLIDGEAGQDLENALKGSMTPALAKYIGDNFTVITQIESLGSGFDATVWKDKSGKLYVSMRGTDEMADLLTDVSLIGSGNARDQIADMANWWLRETTPAGQFVRQIRASFSELNNPQWGFEEAEPAMGTGKISAADLVGGIEVTGHSLGGYLASAFTRLFSTQAHVAHTSTFNSAGFTHESETVFQELERLVGLGYGIGRFPNEAEQTNYFAKFGINVTTNSFWFNQIGRRVDLFNEESTGFSNHGMYKLTDALALGDALSKLDPTLDVVRLNALLNAGANKTEASLEVILDSLRKTLTSEHITDSPIGDVSGSELSRNTFHENLVLIQESIYFQTLHGRVQIVTPPTDGLAAKNDFGALLSLAYLTPFELKPKDSVASAILQSAQPTIGAKWIDDQKLTADERAQGKANFSDQWLEDRARYLEALMEVNAADNDNATSFDQDTWVATDKTLNRMLTLSPIGASGTDANGNSTGGTNNFAQVNQLYFGSDAEDVVTASDGDDHLYGGDGDDQLNGADGNDYLEGNAGSDNLQGGAGKDELLGGVGDDTYKFTAGDGWDTVIDGDGQGSIVIDGITLNGGKETKPGSGLWESDEINGRKFQYIVIDESDGSRTLTILSGDDRILVKNFIDHALNISLLDGAPLTQPQTGRTIEGDLAAIDTDPANPGIQYGYDDLGNILTDPGQSEAGRADQLFDGVSNDLIRAGGGDDVIDAFRGGNDLIEGDDGHDRIRAGGGNDVVLGGTGNDVVAGGDGDDRLYADTEISLAQAIGQGRSQQATGSKGDWLNGGAGDDIVVAGADNDALFGGGGNDILVGGAGNDYLDGDDDYTADSADWSFSETGNPFDPSVTPVTINNYLPVGDDVIYGGDGSDHISGLKGNDILYGETGNDIMAGDDGDDTLLGGAGNDQMTGDYGKLAYDSGAGIVIQGNDYMDGGTGNDFLQGEGGDDQLYGGADDDELWGDAKTYLDASVDGNDYLDGEDGNDKLIGQGGDDELFGGAGDDQLFGDSDQTPVDKQGNDYLDGEDGNDYLRGYGGNDEMFGGAGDDKLLGEDGDDYLAGEKGADVLESGAGNDVLFGGEGNDVLSGGVDGDFLFGDDGNDQLQGGDGNDRLNGGLGNDALFGEAGDDVLDGGDGADHMEGGEGDDIYLDVGKDDTVVDNVGHNKIRFAEGVNAEDIDVINIFDNGVSKLAMSIDGHEFFKIDVGNNSNQSYEFADGNLLTGQELLGQRLFQNLNSGGTYGDDILQGYAGSDYLQGSNGNDQIFGYSGNDTLSGGAGNDILIGGKGDDVLFGEEGHDLYLFSRGDGQDVIDNRGASGDTDVIRFAVDIAKENVTASRQANGDLLLRLNDGTDQITVQGWYNSQANRVARIEFGDGNTLLASDLDALVVPPIEGTNRNDTLTGTIYTDTILGYDGDDVLNGDGGDDTIEGGAGIDTYILKYGMGMDTVSDASSAGNIISLADGLDFSDLDANRDGDDLIIHLAGSEQGMVLKSYYTDPQNWTVRNGDGEQENAEQIVSATRAMQQNMVNAMWRDYHAQLYLSDLTEYLNQGCQLQPDGTLYMPWTQGYWVNNIYANVHESTSTIKTTIQWDQQHYGGGTTSYSYTQTSSNWYTAKPYLYEKHAVLKNITTNSDAPEINAQSRPSMSWTLAYVAAEVKWQHPVQWNNSQNSIQTTVLPTYGGSYSSGAIGTSTAENSYFSRSGVAYGKVTNIFPVGSVPISWDAWPRYVFGEFMSYSYTSTIEEIHAGGSDNAITGNDHTLVDAGDGNDSIYGAGFAYGGQGDDELMVGHILIGGEGNDILAAGEVLVGGAGDDYMDGAYGATRYLIDPSETGHDVIEDSGDDFYDYQDWYYRSIGIGNIRGWESPDEPPPLPFIAANAYADLQPLYDAGVIALDSIEFGPGLNPEDVTVYSAGDNEIVLSWGRNKEITIVMPTEYDSIGTGIELIKFGNGTEWNMMDLERKAAQSEAESIIAGTSGGDQLEGTTLDDTLIGGQGNDMLVGGLGNDIYVLNQGDGIDHIGDASGLDTVQFGQGITTESISLGLGSLLIHYGTAGDMVHIDDFDPGNAEGAPTIETFKFADGTVWTYDQLLSLGFDLSGSGTIFGTSVVDRIIGSDDNDVIFSGDGNDSLSGDNGSDVLDGGIGADIMKGGAGDDTYLVDTADDQVMENADEGVDTVQSSIDYTLDINVENLTLTGSAIRGEGNELGNVITANDLGNELFGGAGNDTLDGGRNADMMTGGIGDDTYVVDNDNDQVIETANQGIDTVKAGIDYALAANVENLILTGTAIYGTGNELDNVITANSLGNLLLGNLGNDILIGGHGNDVLDGGIDADTMSGGVGDDTYIVENVGDSITENENEGIDTVRSDIDYVLGANLEDLTLTGSATQGTGSELDNIITANDLGNRLSGSAGNDTLNGGAGNDFLDGGSDADMMRGGQGDDSYIVDNSEDQVVEIANEGDDTVQADIDYTLTVNVENLMLSGSARQGKGNELNNVIIANDLGNILFGDVGNDTLTGGAGSDILDGGASADMMQGGRGDDVYVIDNAGDRVIEGVDAGIDTVHSDMNYMLGANLENLTLFGSATQGRGNELNNILQANDLGNTLIGEAGHDTLVGDDGSDTLLGGDGNDILAGGIGNDVLNGGQGDDIYVYGIGDGLDTLLDAGGSDTVKFGVGLSLDNVALRLTTENGVTTAHVRVLAANGCEQSNQGFDFVMNRELVNDNDGWRHGRGHGDDRDNYDKLVSPIEAFEFADGVRMTWTDLQIDTQYTFARRGDTEITAGRNDDVIFAGPNPYSVIHAGTGNDIVHAHNLGYGTHGRDYDNHGDGSNWRNFVAGDSLYGEGGDDILYGANGNDLLDGAYGVDILFGDRGDDTLQDVGGNNALLGDDGDDMISGGRNADFIAGGQGADVISTGVGANVIAFNKHDGRDTILPIEGAINTLSLGGGIRNRDLVVSKSGNNLIFEVGSKDQIIFKDWYADSRNQNFVTLQMIEDASGDYRRSSGDKLSNNRIEEFDFKKLIDQFDSARNATPALDRWSVMNGLLDIYLSGSDTAAIGGELAYQYGHEGNWTELGVVSASDTLKQIGFGNQTQSIHRNGIGDILR